MENQLFEELKFARKKNKITQEEMAEMLGISTATYCKIENGQRKSIKKEYLRKMSAILGLNYQELITKAELELDEEESLYYDSSGNPMNIALLAKNIYVLDPDVLIPLLEALKDEDNRKIIDKLLVLLTLPSMYKEQKTLLYSMLELFEK
ncbi:MAG: helix-turn-helix transcriptional regulator [Clostridia bacterium]|nr:helix-turn-helix transcriptional regulator [Clostridia bacterium]